MTATLIVCLVVLVLFFLCFNMAMIEIALYWQMRAEQAAAHGAPVGVLRRHQQKMRAARRWAPLARFIPHYRARLYGEIKR
jgi:hypothetical protein